MNTTKKLFGHRLAIQLPVAAVVAASIALLPGCKTEPEGCKTCCSSPAKAADAKRQGGTPASFVRPFLGTAEHGHVYPGATVPFGMVQLSPDTRDTSWDGCSGYHYSDGDLRGFSHNHLTGTGCADLGYVLVIPTVGELKMRPGGKPGEGYRTRFSHDQEEARPGYYRVFLPDYKVNVELTATTHAGMHRYTFPETSEGHVIVDLRHGIDTKSLDSQITIESDSRISGYRKGDGWGGDKMYFFVMEFSRPFNTSGLQVGDKMVTVKEARGRSVRGHFDFATKAGDQILARVGLSSASVEGARRNLKAEMPGWDFDGIAAAAFAQWDKALSRMTIETADEKVKETFYTALYHSHLAPTIHSDVDGQFRGPDEQVHQAKGFTYYTELSLWDTFRAEHPLLTLCEPGRVDDFVQTMLSHYTIFGEGTLPVWTEGGKENWCMIGNHAIPVIAEAFKKGLTKANPEEALGAMVSSVNRNREQLDQYRSRGYITTGQGTQSVAKLLEYCYDDSCIARLAQAQSKTEVFETSAKRSENWRNVFDPETGLMRGRTQGGGWVTPFDPRKIDFNDYTEANAWQYSFFIPHNMPGLVEKMGGDDKFVAKLDEMFDTQEKIPNSLSDVTGVIGMYAHGNEPCHHVAYLYNYAGQPWKTQSRIRQVANTLYDNSVGGLCGNDDCGQTSAWYVFSALGFYPVDPASATYVIGSPLVDKVTLNLDPKFYKGGTFTIVAKNNSAKNIYIQSATLNGKPLTRSWISHEEIVAGGELVLTMGAEPNKAWGSAVADRPGKAL
jgi:predicted alpha-1,2-mannosidase